MERHHGVIGGLLDYGSKYLTVSRASALINFVIVDNSFGFAQPEFLHLINGENDVSLLTGLL